MTNQQLSTNTFGVAKWIVSPTASDGTHTTIAGALTAASSGDTIFIRPGTYTENPTLKAGVNLTAFTGDGMTPNVTVSGTCTLTAAGTVTISGVRLQTNSAALLAVTGSAASIVNLVDCYVNCTNTTGITFSSSSGSAAIFLQDCRGDVGTTGIGIFAHSSSGTLSFRNSSFTNSGASTTSGTCSGGVLNLSDSILASPITVSSTGVINNYATEIDSSAQNSIPLTVNGSGTSRSNIGRYAGGTAVALAVGSGVTYNSTHDQLVTSNTSIFTNAGTINWKGTTSTNTFTPAINFGGGTTGITYSIQEGYYEIIGGLCFISIFIALTSKGSSTGQANIQGLPFPVGTNGANTGIPIASFSNLTLTTNYTQLQIAGNSGATTGFFTQSIPSGGTSAQLSNTNFANTTSFALSGFYALN